MQRVFRNVPNIFGFDSIGPSGNTVEPFLKKYFDKIGDYKTHLLNYYKADILNNIEKLNALGTSWDSTMQGTHKARCSGVASDDPSLDPLCSLFLASNKKEKLLRIETLLKREDRALFLPAIVEAVETMKEEADTPLDQEVTERIRQNLAARGAIENIIKSETSMPKSQMDLLNLANTFQWIDEEELARREHEIIKSNVAKANQTAANFFCSLDFEVRERQSMTINNFPKNKIRTTPVLQIAGCARSSDPELVHELVEFVKTQKTEKKVESMPNLGRLGTSEEVDSLLISMLKEVNENHMQKVISAIGRRAMNLQSNPAQEALISLLSSSDSEINSSAAKYLRRLKLSESQQHKILNLYDGAAENSKGVYLVALLGRNLKSENVKKEILKKIETLQPQQFKSVFQTLKHSVDILPWQEVLLQRVQKPETNSYERAYFLNALMASKEFKHQHEKEIEELRQQIPNEIWEQAKKDILRKK